MDQHSISFWIQRLGENDEEAAAHVWDHCFEDLVRIAKRRLRTLPNRMDDEEDLAISALHSLCRGATENRFRRLNDRNDLWTILMLIAGRKVAKRRRYHTAEKRGGGTVRGESAFGGNLADGRALGIDDFAIEETFTELLDAECDEWLRNLQDEQLYRIAKLKLEGYTNKEIAKRIERAESTVELKMKLLRSRLRHQMDE